MSRTGRVAVLAAAWLLPAAWVLGALMPGPSDGTSLPCLSSPGPCRP